MLSVAAELSVKDVGALLLSAMSFLWQVLAMTASADLYSTSNEVCINSNKLYSE